MAALIEHLDLAPAHVAGISFGGSIALRLAAQYPELIRSVAAQEPPLFDLVADDSEHRPVMREVRDRIAVVAATLAAGECGGRLAPVHGYGGFWPGNVGGDVVRGSAMVRRCLADVSGRNA